MQLRDYFGLLVIFTFIFTGAFTFMNSLGQTYGVDFTSGGVTTSIEEIRNTTQELGEQLQQTETGIDILNISYAVVKGAYVLVKLVLLKIPALWFNFFFSIAQVLYLPDWVAGVGAGATGMISLYFLISITFEVLTVIFKWST